MAKKKEEAADLIQGFSRQTIDTGPELSADKPNYSSAEMAVEEIPGRDAGGPGFIPRQNTFERL